MPKNMIVCPGCQTALRRLPDAQAGKKIGCPRCQQIFTVPAPVAVGSRDVDELLLDWQGLRDQGNEISPDELCADCPELLPKLRERIGALAQMHSFLETGPFDPNATEPYSPTLLAPPPPKIARFEIRRWLGEGAFGNVYEAYDPTLDRAVALKVAKLDASDSAVRTS